MRGIDKKFIAFFILITIVLILMVAWDLTNKNRPRELVIQPTFLVEVECDCCCKEEQDVCNTVTPQITSTPTSTPTGMETLTPTPNEPTNTPGEPTPTPSRTRTPAPTDTPIPTETEVTCYQWLCHKPGTAAEQNYCCDSEGCVEAHLAHGDYLGACEP